MESEIILSIETAVQGGSLSLLANQTEIAEWNGTLEISRAEEVLEQISHLLNENSIDKKQIKLICVSKGAGSLTGEKIGSALAKGLAKSLNRRLCEVDVFESLLHAAGKISDGEYLTAVPFGKNQVQWQKYTIVGGDAIKTDVPQISSKEDFLQTANYLRSDKVLMPWVLRRLYSEEIPDHSFHAETISGSLAKIIALKTIKENASDNKSNPNCY